MLYDSSSEEDTSDAGDTPLSFFQDQDYSGPTLDLRTLLQHFATYTNQKNSQITCLLRLLKRYKPSPDYDSLPSTVEGLLHNDARDFQGFVSEEQITMDGRVTEGIKDVIHLENF